MKITTKGHEVPFYTFLCWYMAFTSSILLCLAIVDGKECVNVDTTRSALALCISMRQQLQCQSQAN